MLSKFRKYESKLFTTSQNIQSFSIAIAVTKEYSCGFFLKNLAKKEYIKFIIYFLKNYDCKAYKDWIMSIRNDKFLNSLSIDTNELLYRHVIMNEYSCIDSSIEKIRKKYVINYYWSLRYAAVNMNTPLCQYFIIKCNNRWLDYPLHEIDKAVIPHKKLYNYIINIDRS